MSQPQPMMCPTSYDAASDVLAFRKMRSGLAALGYNQPVVSSRQSLADVRYVYFMMSGDLVKVGIATDVARRLHNLQAGAPRGLVLRGTREVPAIFARPIERKVHEALSDVAIGREWFSITPKEARAVADPIVKDGWRAFKIYCDLVPWI